MELQFNPRANTTYLYADRSASLPTESSFLSLRKSGRDFASCLESRRECWASCLDRESEARVGLGARRTDRDDRNFSCHADTVKSPIKAAA